MVKKVNIKITPDYICGFFDGEGCVSVKSKQIVITNQDVSILRRIHRTLKNMGIINRLVKAKNCYRLKIHGYHNLTKFHKLVGSNIIEKKNKMLALESSYIRTMLSEKQKEEIIALRKRGYSYRKIVKKKDVPLSTVYFICQKN